MKHRFLVILMVLTMAFSCPTLSGILGGTVDNLLPEPLAGLVALENYQAVLTISFTGSADGQAVETRDSFTQSVWTSQEAVFTTIETVDQDNQPLYIVTGNVGEAYYDQEGQEGACLVDWGPRAGDMPPFLLAALLDPVGTAVSAGQEEVEGVATKHYTFDGVAVGLAEEAQGTGEIWIASDGGYVVKYSLEITAGEAYWGEGRQGTQRIEYLLSEVETRPDVAYPPGCLPVLSDMPAMEDARSIVRMPGSLNYLSNNSPDDIETFYSDLFGSRGWKMDSELRLDGEWYVFVFIRAETDETAFVDVIPDGESYWVSVTVVSAEDETTPPPDQGTGYEGNPIVRVASCLGILLGMDSSHAAPASYHLEAYHRAPSWESGLVYYEDLMSTDVEGENIHFTDRVTSPGGGTATTEAYLIGDDTYEVLNSVVQPPGTSISSLNWLLWPLDTLVVMGTAANGAEAAGTEVLDGRIADVFIIDSDQAAGAIAGTALSVTAARGTVWVDQETGALLKAELDYTAEVKDNDGNVKGSGTGRLEIDVTQVNQVTVTLPGQ
jgi:hypothetical protein